MRLLVTRPEPDNAHTAEALRALGHEVVQTPLLRIEAIADPDLGPPHWAAILVTSANGAWALAGHPQRDDLLRLPVLAVGDHSAEAARDFGFTDVMSAGGDAGDLVRLATEQFAGSPQPLLYLAGEERSRELVIPGVSIRTVEVYRSVKAERFPPAVREALAQGQIDGVLHFSRRSVEAYVECCRGIRGLALKPVHYCLSARTAEPLRTAGVLRILVAAQPDEASLLALVTPRAMPKP